MTSVYVKKPHPNRITKDYPYLLPSFAEDDYVESPLVEDEENNSSEEESENENKENNHTIKDDIIKPNTPDEIQNNNGNTNKNPVTVPNNGHR